MRLAPSLLLALALPACSSSSSGDAACPSGVYADGQCLKASQGTGGGAGAGGAAPFGTEVGATCSQARELVCGHPDGEPASDRVLLCAGGVYTQVLPCPAPGTCSDLEGHTSVHCGTSLDAIPYSIEGDPCVPDQAAACPLDRTLLLVCQGGVWTSAKSCAAGTKCTRTMAGTQGAGWSCPASSASGCVVCE